MTGVTMDLPPDVQSLLSLILLVTLVGMVMCGVDFLIDEMKGDKKK